jgi:hypothetical protein
VSRLQAAGPRPQPRSLVVARQMDAIMLPAHEDAHRWIAQARSIALRERAHAEARMAALPAEVEGEAAVAETRASQGARRLVAQAEEIAEQIRTDSAAAAARIAACAPRILIGARRGAVQVVARSLAASNAPRPSRLRRPAEALAYRRRGEPIDNRRRLPDESTGHRAHHHLEHLMPPGAPPGGAGDA